MEYQSGRLVFREFTEDDFDRFYSVFSDERVMRYAYLEAYTSREDIRPCFETILENNRTVENRKAYEYDVFLSDTGDFIGFADIVIHVQNCGGWGEIGYFLLPAFWGRGFATEITGTLLHICFRRIKLHRVSAACNANNTRSEKIMQKIGMTREGYFRKARCKDGHWDDEIAYGILAEEWEQKTPVHRQ